MTQARKSKEEILSILKQVSFMDRSFRLLEKGDGYLLQVSYLEPDVENLSVGPTLQSSRKWYISPFMTETEIVETAFAACERSMKHVLCEHFSYKGRRVYSPHFDITGRLDLCDKESFDRRG